MLKTILLHVSASILCFWSPTLQAANAAKNPDIPSTLSAASRHATGKVIVPFEYFRQHIYVPVSLQGKPGFIFMLDSGATKNILNLQTSRRLGIKAGRMESEKNIGFGYERIYVAPEEKLDVELGALPAANEVSVLDLNRFEMHFRHRTDGMLGYPFFCRYVVKLDFQKNLLSIFSPDHYTYRGLGIKIPLLPAKNLVVMPVTLGGDRHRQHPLDVVIDTGSNVTLMLYENFLHGLDLESSLLHAEEGKAFGLSGYYPVKRGIVDWLLIGDAETRNLSVDYLEKNEDRSSNRNLPGAIGNGILQSFQVVIFDLPHHRIIFQMNPPPWQPGVVRTTSEP